MLEGIDTYIWSCSQSRHAGFPPQVEAAFRMECGYYKNLEDEIYTYEKDNAGDSVGETFDILAKDKDLTKCSRFFESRNSDWGGELQLHDCNCAICALPVVIITSGMLCKWAG